jgi:hypothetical protein
MKVLFYGGCHANILNRIFTTYCAHPDFSGRLITNYELIESGEKFPYAEIQDYDAVVFSPILNKGEYNTSNLLDFCRNHDLKTVSYTWLQWNGYHPKTDKLPDVEWIYSEFVTRRKDFQSFESFANWALDAFVSEQDILDNKIYSTNRLKENEASAEVEIRLSEIVERYHRTNLLFVAPDHPTTFVYKIVASKIAQRLGIELQQAFFDLEDEFHDEQILAVLPRVEQSLSLAFDSPMSSNRARFGESRFKLKEWLRLSYYAAPSSLACVASTGCLARIGDKSVTAKPNELIMARQAADGKLQLLSHAGALGSLAGSPDELVLEGDWQRFSMRPYAEIA